VEASNATADAASNPAASAPAGDGDGDHDDRGAATPSQPSAAPVSSALKNAREAYELLMSFSQEATKAA
jgi:hypothetical protein